jgi:hypothetical protein
VEDDFASGGEDAGGVLVPAGGVRLVEPDGNPAGGGGGAGTYARFNGSSKKSFAAMIFFIFSVAASFIFSSGTLSGCSRSAILWYAFTISVLVGIFPSFIVNSNIFRALEMFVSVA